MKGTINYKGFIYNGELLSSVPHGYGTWYYEITTTSPLLKCRSIKKIKYSGNWENGKYHGEGVEMNYYKNEKYIGQFQNGKKNGVGRYYKNNALVYAGIWENDIWDKFGALYEGLTYYIGAFQNGKKHGEGKEYKNHLLFYDGLWENNQKTKGRLYINDGCYIGDVKNDLPHGIGEFYINETLVYHGQWANGYRSGSALGICEIWENDYKL